MKRYYQLLKSIFRNRLTLKKTFVPFLLFFFVSFSEVSFSQNTPDDIVLDKVNKTITVYFDKVADGNNGHTLGRVDIYLRKQRELSTSSDENDYMNFKLFSIRKNNINTLNHSGPFAFDFPTESYYNNGEQTYSNFSYPYVEGFFNFQGNVEHNNLNFNRKLEDYGESWTFNTTTFVDTVQSAINEFDYTSHLINLSENDTLKSSLSAINNNRYKIELHLGDFFSFLKYYNIEVDLFYLDEEELTYSDYYDELESFILNTKYLRLENNILNNCDIDSYGNLSNCSFGNFDSDYQYQQISSNSGLNNLGQFSGVFLGGYSTNISDIKVQTIRKHLEGWDTDNSTSSTWGILGPQGMQNLYHSNYKTQLKDDINFSVIHPSENCYGQKFTWTNINDSINDYTISLKPDNYSKILLNVSDTSYSWPYSFAGNYLFDAVIGLGKYQRLAGVKHNLTGWQESTLPPVQNLSATLDNCEESVLTWNHANSSSPPPWYVISTLKDGLYIYDTILGNETSYTISVNGKLPLEPNEILEVRVSPATQHCLKLGAQMTSDSRYVSFPDAPTNFTVEDETIDDSRVNIISWEQNGVLPSKYVISKHAPNSGTEYFIVDSLKREFIDENVNICDKYTYKVLAQNLCTGFENTNGVKAISDTIFNQGDTIFPVNSLEKVLTFDLQSTFNTNNLNSNKIDGSKGYYPNRVELQWTPKNNKNLIEHYKIYRRLKGQNNNYAQIASEPSSSTLFIDNTTDAGVLYEYLVIGEAQCNTESVFTDSIKGVGFRSPTAVVNGQVNYTGGIAVENVKVLLETTTQSGKSINLDGNSYVKIKNAFKDLANQDEFYLENWVYPIDDSIFNIFDHGDFVFRYNVNQFEFETDNETLIFSDSSININQWQHIGLALKNGLLYVFVNGEGQGFQAIPNAFVLTSPDSIKIGQGLTGNLEELRFWSQVEVDTSFVRDTIITLMNNLPDTIYSNPRTEIIALQIARDFSRYLNGNESGLITYLRFDEYGGQFAYDLSHIAVGNYNKNNGQFIGNVLKEVEKPTASQLAYAAYTNHLGSYTAVVPYLGVGQNFTVTPSYKTHQFDPPTTALFLGDGSNVNNGVDFEDISSFKVTGNLYYKNTECAVKDAYILVDGENVVASGYPIKTGPDGKFSVQVPIGHHIIEVSKPGHVFSEGRFPSSGTYDFQEAVSGINFVDSTTVKIIGRVVGGDIEAKKLLHFGKSKNNIGIAHIDFNTTAGCFSKSIETDSLTGEYEVLLPPMKYSPTVTIKNNSEIDFGVFDDLDYSQIPPQKTLQDSVLNISDSTYIHLSKKHHHEFSQTYYVAPIIDVTDADGNEFIGDSTITIYSYAGDTITRNLKTNPLPWPVFANSKIFYQTIVSVFEYYRNMDGGNDQIDTVTTTTGLLKFNNQLANIGTINGIDTTTYPSIKLNDIPITENGEKQRIVYEFQIGTPNFQSHTLPEYSYTKKFELLYENESGEVIPWNPVAVNKQPTGGDGVYRAFVLGELSSGNQFVTNGPKIPEYVLRDPPGTNSFAVREVGKTTTVNKDFSASLEGGISSEDKVSVGADFSAGLGVAVKSIVKNDVSFGLSQSLRVGTSGSQTSVTTNTKEWSTGEGDDAVGANADLYIGKSTNIEYGISKSLQFISANDTVNYEKLNSFEDTVMANQFCMISKPVLRIDPDGYDTYFMYTEKHIKEVLIPNLESLRNNLFLTSPNKYISKLPISDENYGLNNDDKVFGSSATSDTTGVSYTFYKHMGVDGEEDSIRFYNQQVKKWKDAIRLNEKEKALAAKGEQAYEDYIDSLKNHELDELYDIYEDWIEFYAIAEIANIAGLATNSTLIALPLPGAAAAGAAAFSFTSASTLSAANLSHKASEYLLKRFQIIDKFNGISNGTNYSVSGNAPFSSSISHEILSSYSFSTELSLGLEFKLELEGKVNGTGLESERGFSFETKRSHDWGKETANTETVSFTLDEDDGDYMSVDVYQSPMGWGPIFVRKPGGVSKCPYEGEVTTEYYEPGESISYASQQAELPTIDVSPSVLTNIPVNEAAVFNVTLGNSSQDESEQTYNIRVLSETNPFGAIVKIDGLDPNKELTVPYGVGINKVLTVEKGPGSVYNYENISIVFESQCEKEEIADTVSFTARFLPECTEVDFITPQNQWVVNNSFNHKMDITVSDYNINHFDLERIWLQYKPSSEAQWRGLESYWKDTIPENQELPIPQSTSYVVYPWDVEQLPDGAYDLRVVSECTLSDDNSPTYSGVIDRVNPHAFGSPSPADGILDANDDISMKFNEDIAAGSLTSKNFDIRGVLNGSPLRHQASVEFDGSSSYVEIPTGLNLQSRDFTIEFWAQNKDLGNSIFLSQGSGTSEGLKIGTESSGKVFVEIGGEIVKTTGSIPYPSNWHHYAFAYNYEYETVEIFIDGALSNNGSIKLYTDYIGSGKLNIGKSTFGNEDFFEGNIHDLRIWNHTRSLPDVVANQSVQVGKQNLGLLHNWKMDAATGESIEDHIRFRNGVLYNTEWDLNPGGNAITFNQVDSQNYKFSSANVAFVDENDFTIEFWFNGAGTGRQTLFSNGKGDGLGADSLTSWSITKYPNGSLHLLHNGLDNEIVDSASMSFDGNWHHFALSVNRASVLTTYLDGNSTFSIPVTGFRELGSDQIVLGSRYYINGIVRSYDEFFDGSIDEFRIWNLNRSQKQIQRDMRFKLQGDELGLVSYMPFETYVKNAGVFIMDSTYQDVVDTSHHVTFVSNSLSLNGPKIKLPRPVEKIDFDYSVNGDKVVLTPTTPGFRFENVTLDITVKGIKDLHGNSMQSPKTWIAFPDRNQVVWDIEAVSFEIMKDEALTFTKKIVNSGGSVKNFTLENIPNWLTTDVTEGVINPGSTLDITFTKVEGVNIGSYKEDIVVMTDFGYPERLTVSLKVNGEEPLWEVNPQAFDKSMSIIGGISINDVVSIDDEDILYAFVEGQCRGKAYLQYISSTDKYVAFLDVYSNSIAPDTIDFKIYDASTGSIFVDITPGDITFSSDGLIGSLLSPQVFSAYSKVQENHPLQVGWNWISFHLETVDTANLANLLSSVDFSNGDQIKTLGTNTFASYDETLGWIGNLQMSGVKLSKGYKLKVAQADTLSNIGDVVDPTTVPIHINTGWNWIGFVSIRPMNINVALGNLEPQTGDLIKGRAQFSVYDEQLGWIGSLNTLYPNQSYMYKSSNVNNVSFTFPYAGGFKFAYVPYQEITDARWPVNYSKSISNMSAIVEVEECFDDIDLSDWYLGFFDGTGTCRSLSPVDLVEDKLLAFVTAVGADNLTLSPRLLNKVTGQELEIDGSLEFAQNTHSGSYDSPIVVELNAYQCKLVSADTEEEGYVEFAANQTTVYPSVFNSEIHINYFSAEDGKVTIELINALGQIVRTSKKSVDSGNQTIKIGSKLSRLANGSYMLRMTSDSKREVFKLIKQN